MKFHQSNAYSISLNFIKNYFDFFWKFLRRIQSLWNLYENAYGSWEAGFILVGTLRQEEKEVEEENYLLELPWEISPRHRSEYTRETLFLRNPLGAPLKISSEVSSEDVIKSSTGNSFRSSSENFAWTKQNSFNSVFLFSEINSEVSQRISIGGLQRSFFMSSPGNASRNFIWIYSRNYFMRFYGNSFGRKS